VISGGNSSTGTVTLTSVAGPGGVLVQLASSSTEVTVPKSFPVPEGQSSVTFTAQTHGVSKQLAATITATMSTGSKKGTLTVNPPTVSSMSLNPTTVAGGATSTGTVTLSVPASGAGAVVKLTSSSTSAIVPVSVVVISGKNSASFKVRTAAVSAQKTVTISAALNGLSQSAQLTITPPTLISLTLSPASLIGGRSSIGTVKISSAAPVGGLVISLSSSLASATVLKTVTIPPGRTSMTFYIKTKAVSSNTSTTITATQGSTSKAAVLTIT